MSELNFAGQNMQYIQELFMNTYAAINTGDEISSILQSLETGQPLFRSIAFESASYALGDHDLKTHNALNKWLSFYTHAKEKHIFHVEIGLGWAFAKHGLSPLMFGDIFNSHSYRMIYDGIGYFSALYKGRKTIKEQQIPASIPLDYKAGFDQGVGRRLWYMTKGAPNALAPMIHTFPEERQQSLWIGAGIAVGYVGGLSKNELFLLKNSAGNAFPYLRAGIGLAYMSRLLSSRVHPQMEMAINLFFDNPSDISIKDQLEEHLKNTFNLGQSDYPTMITGLFTKQ